MSPTIGENAVVLGASIAGLFTAGLLIAGLLTAGLLTAGLLTAGVLAQSYTRVTVVHGVTQLPICWWRGRRMRWRVAG
jgi:hypothetical protein